MANTGGKDWTPDLGFQVQVGGRADDRSSLPTLITTAGGFVGLITQRVVAIVFDVNTYPLPIKILINGFAVAVPAFLSSALATTIAHYDVDNQPALLKYKGVRQQRLASGSGQHQERPNSSGYQGQRQGQNRPRSTFRQRQAGRQQNGGGYDHKKFEQIVAPPK